MNVYGIDRFGEVSEKTEVMEAEMGAFMMMNEVEIGGKSFKNMFCVAIYEEVGMSQYFEPLVMN